MEQERKSIYCLDVLTIFAVINRALIQLVNEEQRSKAFCDQRASWEHPNLRYGRFSLNCENLAKNCVQHLFPLECVFNTLCGLILSVYGTRDHI